MPDPWTLRYEGFDPAQEGVREVLCAAGNGYLVTRGAAPESRRTASTTPARTWPGATTASPPASRAASSTTRTWSTAPTGCR
ncbi:hypothetical protein [Saccharothrix sp. ST-888]|uniref:hypothetical protein n=1 Tax=Saccharothrix sp. ST-888 TaxID=1427391 RepID=UPI0012E07922